MKMLGLIAIAAAALIAAAVAWMLAASALFLHWRGIDPAAVFNPWWAWLTYEQLTDRGGTYNDFWTWLYLILSAIIPTVAILLIAAITIRIVLWRTRRPAAPIYGNSDFAEEKEMKRNSIGLMRGFFR